MAIVTTITDRLTGSELPSVAHTPNAVTALVGTKFSAPFSTKIATSGNTDPDAETAYDNFEADLKTWIDGTFLPSTVKLDAAASIVGVIYVSRFYPEEADLSDDTQEMVMEGVVEWQ